MSRDPNAHSAGRARFPRHTGPGPGAAPIDDRLSTAVTTFVTCEPHGFPHTDSAALAERFGADEAAELEPRITTLIGEMMPMPMPGADLGAGTRRAEEAMAARHPELDTDAITALGRYFSYSWR